MTAKLKEKILIKVEKLKSISDLDLADLCNITEQAIKAGGGFGWLKVPPREKLNKYWKGLVVVQNNILVAIKYQLVFNNKYGGNCQRRRCTIVLS